MDKISITINGNYNNPHLNLENDLLSRAGFTTLALKERALSLGAKLIPNNVVREFAERLKNQGKEYHIQELQQYLPQQGEVIPVSELQKISKARELNIFDRIAVIGTKTKIVDVDPIVVGVIFNEKEREWWNDYDIHISYITEHDWYFIAGWK